MVRIFIFTIALLCNSLLYSQRDSIGKVLDIGNNEDYEGYEMLDSFLLSKDLFISGEDYDYSAFNSKLEFKLLRYMNYRVGLRNYLVETSPARADLINQYISSGDSVVEKLLQSVSKVKYMRLYKNLKRLNSRLPDSLKIRVYGVDVERSNALPVVKMSQYLPEDSIPDELRISVEAIEGAAKYIITKGLEEYDREKKGDLTDYDNYFYKPSAFSVSLSMTEFLKSYDSLQTGFRNWLGADFEKFDRAVGWLKEFREYNNLNMTAMEYTWREELMFNRVNDLLAEMPGEKFYGQFGLCRAPFSRVDQGCGINKFSGLAHKLKTYPESLGKDLVTIGIFYNDEMLMDEEKRDVQHNLYINDLTRLFENIEDDEAAIADLSAFKNLDTIQKDFNVAILNNGYKLLDDEDIETDSTIDSDNEISDDTWWIDYRNSRVFLGAHMFSPGLKMKGLNNQLRLAGRDTVGKVTFAGAELAIATDNAVGSVFFYNGYSANDNHNYSSVNVGIKGGNCFAFKRIVKAGFFTTLSYVQHKITEQSGSDEKTYFMDYQAPRVYKNPAMMVGFSADVYLDLAPFYLYCSGGWQWDGSNNIWRSNGHYTGSRGALSNTAWFTNAGIGLSVPLRWID